MLFFLLPHYLIMHVRKKHLNGKRRQYLYTINKATDKNLTPLINPFTIYAHRWWSRSISGVIEGPSWVEEVSRGSLERKSRKYRSQLCMGHITSTEYQWNCYVNFLHYNKMTIRASDHFTREFRSLLQDMAKWGSRGPLPVLTTTAMYFSECI